MSSDSASLEPLITDIKHINKISASSSYKLCAAELDGNFLAEQIANHDKIAQLCKRVERKLLILDGVLDSSSIIMDNFNKKLVSQNISYGPVDNEVCQKVADKVFNKQ